MSEIHTFYAHCEYCKHETDNVHDVVPFFENWQGFECVDRDACKRRQKRNKINAEIEAKAAKPKSHPLDYFSRASLTACGAFLLTIIVIGLSYIWFGV
ncbi:membrane protein [Arthrobacter phage Tokki]|nr:membrane protein [Arthrobacter phage Tokki]